MSRRSPSPAEWAAASQRAASVLAEILQQINDTGRAVQLRRRLAALRRRHELLLERYRTSTNERG